MWSVLVSTLGARCAIGIPFAPISARNYRLDTKILTSSSEVRDRTAFTVKFGVNGEVRNFGFGVGYGFVGSENTTNHQVYGNVRYRF